MDFEQFKGRYQHAPVRYYPNTVERDPLVSVCIQTYQHAGYIEACLQSILMQETEFSYEILLGEDASSDGTREICMEYADKYPDTIRLFLHSRKNNIERAGQPTGRFNLLYNFYNARGTYIALCEGDDYWTDPLKLKKQVAFMREHKGCSLCFHAAEHIFEGDPGKNFIHRPQNIPADKIFLTRDVIPLGGTLMATSSMFFKKAYVTELPEWLAKADVGDVPLLLILAVKGNTGYIDETMSIYRRGVEGSWTESLTTLEKIKKRFYARIKMWDYFDEWSGHKYRQCVNTRKRKITFKFMKIGLKFFLEKLGLFKLFK